MPRRKKDRSAARAEYQRKQIEFKATKKRCSNCKQYLNRIAFYKDSSRPDGISGICKTCRSIHAKNTKEHRNEVRNALRRKRRILSLNKTKK